MNDLRMFVRRSALVSATVPFALLCGCVMMPTAPMVPAMAGSQKTMEQFASDDANCRGYAQAGVNGPSQAATNNVAANTAASTVFAAAAGALIGSVSGNAGAGAAIGAGTGLLFGSAAGSGYASASTYQLQSQYDALYLQCMYEHGHRVPGNYVHREAKVRRYSPSAYPPPNYPAPYPPANYPAPYPPPDYPAPAAATSGSRT